jgi:lipopolysaccharide/colanic/teichoic acid biosynthesis glycosyltransferase
MTIFGEGECRVQAYAKEVGDDVASLALGEDRFRSAITRERKRTERSGLAIVLFLISIEGSEPNSDSPEMWTGVVRAVAAVKSEIDLIGWFKQDATIGLLVLDIDASKLMAVCERLEMDIRKALTDRLDERVTSRLSIGLRVYPEPLRSEEEASQSVDFYLFPELHEGRASIVWYEAVKRGLDIVGSLTLVILLAPLLAAVALAVKATSRGPVIFRQVRIGRKMKPFMILKFRTMHANADHGIHHNYVTWFITASDRNKTQGTEKEKVFKLTNDPRITPIGQFLRKTSLDELPQLWNVLKGDMSLVGPRPPLWYELQQYKPWHRHRVLEAKPGITGLWQVKGRSRTTFDEMVRLDLRYARTKSFWVDIKILLATPIAVIRGKGAC